MIKGILFDMDGVLVDSEEFICEAAIRMFAEHNVRVKPEDFVPFVGMGENNYLSGVAIKYNFNIDIERDKARTYAIYIDITKGRLTPLKGVFEFIEKCKIKGLLLAVASSADKVKVDANLKEIGLSNNTFDAIVNGIEVDRKKPFPDIFIKAAERLDLKPQDCLVVEDAPNGVEAARKAGAKVLGLTTSFKESELKESDWIAANLKDAPDEVINW